MVFLFVGVGLWEFLAIEVCFFLIEEIKSYCCKVENRTQNLISHDFMLPELLRVVVVSFC